MGESITGAVARWTTVGGLLVCALGVLVLRFSGVAMPPVPPALVLLVGAAVLVALVGGRWAPVVGVVVAAAETAGFVLTGGPGELFGAASESVAITVGSWLRGVGVAVAAVAGVVAVCAPQSEVPPTGATG
jgi:hypothetical protein